MSQAICGCVVDGASVDDAVGGEEDVVEDAVVVDVVVEINAVDCAEVDGLAADDGGRGAEVSAGSGFVVAVEAEVTWIAGISKGERIGMSRDSTECERGCGRKQREFR